MSDWQFAWKNETSCLFISQNYLATCKQRTNASKHTRRKRRDSAPWINKKQRWCWMEKSTGLPLFCSFYPCIHHNSLIAEFHLRVKITFYVRTHTESACGHRVPLSGPVLWLFRLDERALPLYKLLCSIFHQVCCQSDEFFSSQTHIAPSSTRKNTNSMW